MTLCVNCKYFEDGDLKGDKDYVCTKKNPPKETHLVTGVKYTPAHRVIDCEEERYGFYGEQWDRHCGKTGRFFEPK